MPVSPTYQPEQRHGQLGGEFFDQVEPAMFPKHVLRFRNNRWAKRIGLESLSDEEWISHFGAFKPLPNNYDKPLALRYHGHQFRAYNPELGDGRGFLFAQMRDQTDNRLLDLGTKGSGQTPWSRQGDGRLTLKGGIREVLATEMLEALGVETSKSFSLIETGEALYRGDEPSPTRSSVLVRLGHSHIRFGSFQRLLVLDKKQDLRTLIDYVIETYWPKASSASDPVAAMFGFVVDAIAHKGARWFAAGFVHGVLNTYNMAITGESFDYGPWRFLPTLDPAFTAAYFDQNGLYSFGRQPEALNWNLARLAECLLGFTDQNRLENELDRFSQVFEEELVRQTLSRLCLRQENSPQASELVRLYYLALRETGAPFERAFFDLAWGAPSERQQASPSKRYYDDAPFRDVIALIRDAEPLSEIEEHPYFHQDRPATMLVEDVEGIWEAVDREDDWTKFTQAVEAIRKMGQAYKLIPQSQLR